MAVETALWGDLLEGEEPAHVTTLAAAEAETVPLLSSAAAAPIPAGGGDDADIQFDRMSEEDLLRGLEGLVPPAESDDEE